MHAGPFQTRFHYQLVGTFHAATADRIPQGLKAGIVHEVPTLLQIGQTFLDRLSGPLAAGSPCTHLRLHLSERLEYLVGLTVLEFMQGVVQPRLKQGRAFAQDGLPGRRHILGGMGEIQNTNGVFTMQVNEPLFPLGAIGNGADLLRRFRAPADGVPPRPVANSSASAKREK
jgi:hypothetical protein